MGTEQPGTPAQPQPQPPAGAGVTPTGPAGAPLAEWWKRLVAIIIDNVIVAIPSQLIGALIFAGMFAVDPVTFNPQTGQFEGGAGFFGRFLASWGALVLMSVLIGGAYFTYLHASRGQTVGKMAMKIKVVDQQSGGLIDYGRAALRFVIPFGLSWLTCGIGALLNGLWPLWDSKRQTWHDKVAKTQVVDVA